MTATPPTTAKSIPVAVRSANSFSNGEIISFADQFTVLGDVAGDKLEVMEPRQDVPGIERPSHDPPDRLLHRLDFKRHHQKLPVSTRRVKRLVKLWRVFINYSADF